MKRGPKLTGKMKTTSVAKEEEPQITQIVQIAQIKITLADILTKWKPIRFSKKIS